MIPERFHYRRAQSVPEALEWLSQDVEGTKLVAGGHSLLPLMKLRLASPRQLIDVAHIPELLGVRRDHDHLIIGASTTYRSLGRHPLIVSEAPVIAMACQVIGDLQVRNRGTIGGSLSHADPAADLPAVMLALDVELTVQSRQQVHQVSIHDWLLAPLVTMLDPGHMLTEIIVPRLGAAYRMTYLKRPHAASGYATVGVAVVMSTDDDGVVNDIRIAVTGAASIPYRARALEETLTGTHLTQAMVSKVSHRVIEDGLFEGDAVMGQRYREQLVRVYVEQALRRVMA